MKDGFFNVTQSGKSGLTQPPEPRCFIKDRRDATLLW